MRGTRGLGAAWILLLAMALHVALAGCASNKVVTRVGVEEQVDLSGNWNDTDSRMVSDEMIGEMLGGPWLERWGGAKPGGPVLICGSVRNLSLEHIAVGAFVKDIERAVINSAQAQVVASAEERGEVRAEREEQRIHASPETLKEMGREVGADFMLIGEINQINDREKKEEIKYYQVDLTLVNIETNIKTWAGQKKIKKYISTKPYKP